MNIACLFDGAGLARLGLERAGHRVTGYELDPDKHRLSLSVGSGNCVLADVADVDLTPYDAVWLSPPCQGHSEARTQGAVTSAYAGSEWLQWSLDLTTHCPDKVIWVENVMTQTAAKNNWGVPFNAAQFLLAPIQCRNRMIGGRYIHPTEYRPYKHSYPEFDLCPCITASEYKGCATDGRRASRYYGRRLTVDECAYHQGFEIPDAWRDVPEGWTRGAWMKNLYEAIGNGVPVYMAEAFGWAYQQ